MIVTGSIILFSLTLLPPVYLRLLPFQKYITAEHKRGLYRGYVTTFILETIALWVAVVKLDLLPITWLTYKYLMTIGWIPYFILNIFFIRHYLAQHLFILGMQFIYTICIHTISMNILLLFIPSDVFFYYLPLQFILYIILFFLCFPLVRPFFTEIFSRFHPLNNRYFWNYICPLPLILCINEAYFAMSASPLSQILLLPRICLGIAGIIMAVCVRTGLLQLEQHVQLYKNNYALLAQMQSMDTYTQTLENSQLHMSILRHNNRHHLSVLSELIREDKKEEALQLIEKVSDAFNQTKVEQFCTNSIINAALTVYISKVRNANIPISASLDIPHTLETNFELAIVLSNLIENAFHASLLQPKEQRHIDIIAKTNGDILNIVVKNKFDGTVKFDREGFPMTNEKGHGLGMKSLTFFRNKTDATIFCNHKDGWFSTYIQFKWKN